jgi:hypothetical protein
VLSDYHYRGSQVNGRWEEGIVSLILFTPIPRRCYTSLNTMTQSIIFHRYTYCGGGGRIQAILGGIERD